MYLLAVCKQSTSCRWLRNEAVVLAGKEREVERAPRQRRRPGGALWEGRRRRLGGGDVERGMWAGRGNDGPGDAVRGRVGFRGGRARSQAKGEPSRCLSDSPTRRGDGR